MSNIQESCENEIKKLEQFPVEYILPEKYKEPLKDFLKNCKSEHSDILALSMAGKIELPAKYGYSIADMALGIAPITAGQAVVFFETIRLVREYYLSAGRQELL